MTTILIVEDDSTLQEVLTSLLHHDGYQVLTAAHGYAALEVLQQHPVDLILSDVLMPGLDGIAFYLHLRAAPAYRAIPVILISALPLRRSLSDPHIIFLEKPLDLAALLVTIERMLTHSPTGSDGAAG